MPEKSYFAPHSNCLDLRNAIVPLIIQSASHDQRSYIAPHFNHFDLRKAMVPLVILLASHDQKVMCHLILIIIGTLMTLLALNVASANGITSAK